jgi:hypothetical protein
MLGMVDHRNIETYARAIRDELTARFASRER